MQMFPLFAGLILLSGSAFAETVKDREGAVRGDRDQLQESARWNYENLEGAFSQAASSGKPLLVVLRCIPCKACMGIDTSVVAEDDLGPLLDRFVCVRLINANALDLTRFQFDYDLSFSAMVFNADGTIYGRYGSWLHQKEPDNATTASFRRALEAALDLHMKYPAIKMSLGGKQGGLTPYRTPVEFPTLAAKYQSKLDWEGKVAQSCVHCHMVGDAFRAYYRGRHETMPTQWIYPQPSPQVLGLTLASSEIAMVEAVAADSPAAKSGFLVGDRLTTLDSQPLISVADVSWALHRAPEAGQIPAVVQREGRAVELHWELPGGWRAKSDISRRVGTWPMRGMVFGGMVLKDLDDAERRERGLGLEGMALRVEHVGEHGIHGAAKREGFRPNDIVTGVAQHRLRASESALIGSLLQEHQAGQKLPATVLRGTEHIPLLLPQQ